MVLSQETQMNMKAQLLTIQKLWSIIKLITDRQTHGQDENNMRPYRLKKAF